MKKQQHKIPSRGIASQRDPLLATTPSTTNNNSNNSNNKESDQIKFDTQYKTSEQQPLSNLKQFEWTEYDSE
jgi:hypothetical protein